MKRVNFQRVLRIIKNQQENDWNEILKKYAYDINIVHIEKYDFWLMEQELFAEYEEVKMASKIDLKLIPSYTYLRKNEDKIPESLLQKFTIVDLLNAKYRPTSNTPELWEKMDLSKINSDHWMHFEKRLENSIQCILDIQPEDLDEKQLQIALKNNPDYWWQNTTWWNYDRSLLDAKTKSFILPLPDSIFPKKEVRFGTNKQFVSIENDWDLFSSFNIYFKEQKTIEIHHLQSIFQNLSWVKSEIKTSILTNYLLYIEFFLMKQEEQQQLYYLLNKLWIFISFQKNMKKFLI